MTPRRHVWRIRLAWLVPILAVSALLRFSGLDWDQGQHLHPDERFLTMVAVDTHAPESIAGYFDTARSPLNPSNAGYEYFVYGTFPVFFVKVVAAAGGWHDYHHLHLVGRASAAFFDTGTVLLAYVLGLLLAGPAAAVGAAALMAFSVTSIQHAHFFTVDSFGTFFAMASLVLLVQIERHRRLRWHLLFGIAFGVAVACRIQLVLLGVLYALALVHAWRMGTSSVRSLIVGGALGTVAAATTFRLLQPYAFAGPGLFGLAPAAEFIASMNTIGQYTIGAAEFPPSVQWIGRIRVLFPGWNLLTWGIGPAWGLAALVAVPWCLWRRRPAEGGTDSSVGRLVLLWIPLLFLFHATQFVATGRYFLPIVPPLAVAVAWWLTAPAPRRRLRRAVLVATVVLSAAWALAFTSVYRQPHTRVEASRWIYEQVPAGATIATEHWDDALPLDLDDRTRDSYRRVELTLYDEPDEQKRAMLVDTLNRTDLVVLSSNRLYGSIPRAPWRYPLVRRYYELLFAGRLGFDLERTFTSYPGLGPLRIPDHGAEEAFTVYDHPQVLVFRKASRYDPDQTARLLGAVSISGAVRAPPADVPALYRQAWPGPIAVPQETTSRRDARPDDDAGSLASLFRWLMAFELLSLAAFALLARPLATARDRGYGLSKLVAWLGPGTAVWLLASVGLAPNAAGTAWTVGALFLAAGGVAAWRQRAHLREVWRADYRTIVAIEVIFLASIGLFLLVRAFNPAISWGEKPMDFAFLNTSLRTVGMPPPDPWYAGETLNYFYFGHAVTAVFARMTGVGPAFAFNLALGTVAAMLAAMVASLVIQMTGRVLPGVWGAVLVVVAGNLAGVRRFLDSVPEHLGFDYFWSLSRVVPGTINEFPFWNLIFGDLHAHVLAMPLQVGMLYVGCLWVAGRGPDSRPPAGLLAAVSAWLLGAIATTSSWGLPTASALLFGFLVTAWRQRGPLSAGGLARYSVLWLGIVAGAFAIFRPFWSTYDPAAATWGWVTSEAARAVDVVTIFGIFLLLALPPLVASVVRSTRAWTAWFVAAAVVAAAFGLWRSTAAGLFAGWTILALCVWLTATRSAVRLGALLVGFAGGLGLATEVVFVADRMNTVFKYYLEMWLTLGSGAVTLAWGAYAAARRPWRRIVAGASGGLVAAGLFTSATGTVAFLREPRAVSTGPTLDGLAYLASAGPEERDAYRWLNREIEGIPVVLEASGPPYEEFGRVSMNTGLPTVLGWQYHLIQQGRPPDQIAARAADVTAIYTTTDIARAEMLLRRFHVDLVYVGPLERRTYPASGLAKFDAVGRLEPVFRNREVTIYATAGFTSAAKTWIDRVSPRPALPIDAPLREPRGVALGPDGTIVVADFGNRRVLRVARDLRPIAAFGAEGGGPGEFRDPCGVTVDADANIWVADTWNHRIQKLTADGRLLQQWEADFWGPRGIAVSPDGTAYVADTGRGRVVRIPPGGEPAVLVGAGVLDNPIGIAVDARGAIVVADTGHQRLVVFDQDGRQVREWPVPWRPGARMEPYVAVGPDGDIWVTDPSARQVLLFDGEGRALGEAVPAVPIDLPLGIAVRDRDTAIIADAGTGQLVEVRRPTASR